MNTKHARRAVAGLAADNADMIIMMTMVVVVVVEEEVVVVVLIIMKTVAALTMIAEMQKG